MPRHIAARRLALIVLLLALGVVGGASGRELATTTIQVQVIGGGLVSGGGQIACGSGSKNCYATFVTGDQAQLTATDQGEWTFSEWTGCFSTGGTDGEICTVKLDGSETEVTANFTSSFAGSATLSVNNTSDSSSAGGNVSGGEIDCDTGDSSCTDDVFLGSTITLVETPDSGYSFNGWGGPCSGTDKSCTVQINSDVTVNAAFKKSESTFALTVSVTGNGVVAGGGISCTSAGGSSCSADVSPGTTVTLTAQPGSGASFNGWGGACAGTSLSCSVTLSSAKSVTASFSGSSGTASQFPLGVSVTGNGTVTGGGIRCGSGETTCTVNETTGATVTLTATPDSGATFTSWGGACTGSSTTCSVTMNVAKSVTATFSGGTTSGTVALTVTVTGPGSVSGGGIQCGNGGATCTAKENEDSEVTLTATPARNATFTGWNGACSGTGTTCTVTMDAAKSVSAAFKSTSRTPSAVAGRRVLRSRGQAIVRRTANGFLVTLRFVTTRRGIAHVRAVLAGRLQTALSFPVAPGTARVGPFPVVKPGFYAFEVRLGPRQVRWAACLGRCGAAAHAPAFVVVRGPTKAVDAGAVWSVTVRFRETLPSGARIRVLRSGRLARVVRFAAPVGAVTGGPFLLSPGTYRLHLTATDAYGRVRTLSWYALLP
jgi:uncharacterized repeat protein (TIGR02543 family)